MEVSKLGNRNTILKEARGEIGCFTNILNDETNHNSGIEIIA